MFSGGALGKVSIIALGIGPYIPSSIIMQLMAVIIPALEKLQKEERKYLSRYYCAYDKKIGGKIQANYCV